MALSDHVHTLGQDLLRRHGERVHKLAIDAGFTCPNRDGAKGSGGCTFCNNASFSPNGETRRPVAAQLAAGRAVIARRTGARKFLAYFQAYTGTYGDPERLVALWAEALAEPDVIGIAVGTRPDCCPPEILDRLARIRDEGREVWLELGLQSAFDETLARVNRGHGWADYCNAIHAARERGLPVCTHLIVGLPGEGPMHARITLERVLAEGVEGLKLHPLHVVEGTMLAAAYRRGEYRPWTLEEYFEAAADLIVRTPSPVVYHRVTGTSPEQLLLAPSWCAKKWAVLNGIERELVRRGVGQGGRTIAHPPAPVSAVDGRAVDGR